MSTDILIIGQFPPPFHGSNIMTERFYNSLKKEDYQVSIVEKTFSKKIEEVEKYTVKKFFKVPLLAIKIVCNVILQKPDICFYFNSVKTPLFYIDVIFMLLIRLCGSDVVLCIHGKGLQSIYEKSNWIFKLFWEKGLSRALGAFVLGEMLRDDINSFISNESLFVLPNCIPDKNVEAIASCIDRRDKNVKQVLFLSNLAPQKGPIEFLKMAKRIVNNLKNVRFILAGPVLSNEFCMEIKQFIRDENLENYVNMPGAVYGDAKERLFIESDIFVFPARSEAFGLVNLEAMRAGLPVISSNEGSIPEVVMDGINGYIVDPQNVEQLSNRVLKLVNNDDLRIEMGEAGRKIFEKSYTIQIYEKRLHEGMKFFLKLAGLDSPCNCG